MANGNRQFRYWLFHLLAGLSLAVFILSLGLLIHSFFAIDEFIIPGAYRPELSYSLWIVAWHGHLSLALSGYENFLPANVPAATQPRRPRVLSNGPDSQRRTIYEEMWDPGERDINWHFGFAAYHEVGTAVKRPKSRMELWFVAIPLWLITLSAAVLPALWLRSRWATRRRAELGLCSTCGYDLRATPDRCPECGAIPSTEKNQVR